MFIYIDESGTFAYPRTHRHSYACAGALTIPERRHGTVLKSFKTLTRKWGLLGKEIKGRKLNETQVAQVIHLLIENGAKFHACATDMLYYTPSLVNSRKDEQAKRLLANVTDQHHPNLVHQLNDIGDKIRQMPDQLFIQLCVMIDLVNTHLHDMMIYFAKQEPSELGSFRWVADRKGNDKTIYEELWQDLLTPVIQGRQFSDDFNNKIIFLEDGDYDYCQKFFLRLDKWPDYLPEQEPGLRKSTDIDAIDIGHVLKESFTLADSADKPGLQLADIVTNTLRRALMGNFQVSGWSELGRLMFRWKDKAVQLVHFGDPQQPSIQMDDKYATNVIKTITSKAGFVI
jgi:hypothetical protein